jgi:ABC-type uncharacterized transport system permease subunit
VPYALSTVSTSRPAGVVLDVTVGGSAGAVLSVITVSSWVQGPSAPRQTGARVAALTLAAHPPRLAR